MILLHQKLHFVASVYNKTIVCFLRSGMRKVIIWGFITHANSPSINLRVENVLHVLLIQLERVLHMAVYGGLRTVSLF